MLACSSAAEQTAVNRPVVGSIPTVPAKRLWAGSLRGKNHVGAYLRRYWNRGQSCPLISHFPYALIINPFTVQYRLKYL